MFSNPFDLSGLSVLVTGAGRGIGRGCALALARAGAEVVGVSRTEAELNRWSTRWAVEATSCST